MNSTHQQKLLPTVLLVTGIVSVVIGSQHYDDGVAAFVGIILFALGAFTGIFGAAWIVVGLIRELNWSERTGRTVTVALLLLLVVGAGGVALIHMLRSRAMRTEEASAQVATESPQPGTARQR